MSKSDFSEVAHTGGKVTFFFETDADGRLRYSIQWSHSRPTPASLCGIYAHPDGFACGNIKMGGMGVPWNPPPFPNCVAVMMASDTESRFGHECPQCHKHFRTTNIPAHFPLTCPYCAARAESFHFLTPPQRAYIRHYIAMLESGLQAHGDKPPNSKWEVVIDMDALADLVPGEARPDFYYPSIVQQTRFKCIKCDSFNDIRGRYGYCANCGWRNNRSTVEAALASLREKLNNGMIEPSDAVKQAVSEFDSAARNFVDELEARSPMKESRRNELQNLLFHGIDQAEALLRSMFGIDFMKPVASDRDFVKRMFLRRHVYEHDGGVATARYVRESGDTTIAEGELIRETKENAHNLMSSLNRMTAAFDEDFHELFPPEPFCIEQMEAAAATKRKRSEST